MKPHVGNRLVDQKADTSGVAPSLSSYENVRVIVEEAPSPSPNGPAVIDRLIGMVNDEGGPTDVAERHDEYLYGGLKAR